MSVEEIRRLNELFQDIKALDEAISKLGIPQHDYPATSSEDIERDGLVAGTRLHRMLIYENGRMISLKTARMTVARYGC